MTTSLFGLGAALVSAAPATANILFFVAELIALSMAARTRMPKMQSLAEEGSSIRP